tara:strand:+ start:1079 stop:6181 length:5103 start_codon:yes stop_codon:yes gene_type:complete
MVDIIKNLDEYKEKYPEKRHQFVDDNELLDVYYHQHKDKVNEAGYATIDEYKKFLGVETRDAEEIKEYQELKQKLKTGRPEDVSTIDNIKRTLGPFFSNLANTGVDAISSVGRGSTDTGTLSRPAGLRGMLIRPANPYGQDPAVLEPEVDPEQNIVPVDVSNNPNIPFKERFLSDNKTTYNEKEISEKEYLLRMMLAEAQGEGTTGMAVVARSILNRVGLLKSGDVRKGSFNDKEASIIGVLTGNLQYAPFSDGRLFDFRDNKELKDAESALKLALNPELLREILGSKGVPKDRIENLLASTGFRSLDAKYDSSQDINPTVFGNHEFNTAGNTNKKSPILIRPVAPFSKEDYMADEYDKTLRDYYGENGPGNTFSKANKKLRFTAEQKMANAVILAGETILGKDNIKLQTRDGIVSLDTEDPTYYGGKTVADIASLAANLVGWQKTAVSIGPKLAKNQKVAKWFRNAMVGISAEQTGWDIYDENRMLNFLGDYIQDDPSQKSDVMKYLEGGKDDSQLEARVSLIVEGALMAGVATGVFKTAQFSWQKGIKPATSGVLKRLRQFRTNNSDELNAFRKHLDAATVWGRRRAEKKGEKIIDTDKLFDEEETLDHLWQLKGAFNDDSKLWNTAKRKAYQWLGGSLFKSRGNYTPKLFELMNVSKQARDAWRSRSEMLVEILDNKVDFLANRVARDKGFIDRLMTRIKTREFTPQKRKDYKDDLLLKVQSAISGESVVLTGAKKVSYWNIDQLPKTVQPIVKEIRGAQDELSELYMKSDYVPDSIKKIINSRLGKYLRKSYNWYEAGKMPSKKTQQNAIKYFEGVLRRSIYSTPGGRKQKIKFGSKAYDIVDGKVILDGVERNLDDVIKRNAKGTVEGILNDRSSATDLFSYVDAISGRLRGQLKARKDVPKAIKALLGESKDPRGTVLTSMVKLANAVETDKFLENAWKLGRGKYFHSNPDQIFSVQLKGNNWGAMNNKWTTPEMARIFRNRPSSGVMRQIAGWALQAKGYGQAAKTVLNHITHLRNTFGGGMFMAANGMNPFSSEAKEAFKVLKSKASNNREGYELYTKYQGLGVVNTNAKAGDFKALIDDAADFGIDGSLTKLMKKYTAGNLGKIQKLYIYEDDLFKITSFEKELKTLRKAFGNDMTESQLEREAANIVRNTIPNYDLVPHGIKQLRKLPFGNFFSFPAEMIRTSFNIVRQAGREMASDNLVIRNRGYKRAGGFMGAGIMGSEVTGYVTKELAGVDDTTDEAIRHLLEPDYNKYTNRAYMRGEDGALYKNNFSFIDPYDILKEPLRVILMEYSDGKKTQEDRDKILISALTNVTNEFIQPFTSQALLTESLTDVFLKEGRTDRGLIEGWDNTEGGDTTDRTLNNVFAGLKHIANTFTPGSVPQLNKWYKSTRGGELFGTSLGGTKEDRVLKSGQELDPVAETIANLTGFRWNKVDRQYVESSLQRKIGTFANQQRLNRSKMRSKINVENNEIDFIQSFVAANKNQYKNWQELSFAVEAADNLFRYERLHDNWGGHALRLVEEYSEKKAGLTKDQISSLSVYNGKFVPLELSDGDKENIQKKLKFETIQPVQLFGIITKYTEQFKKMPSLDLEGASTKTISEQAIGDKGKMGKETIERIKKFKGETISKDYPVANVVEDPSERINQYTGLPFDAEVERLEGTDILRNVLKSRRTRMHGGGHLLKHKLKKRLTA